MAYQFDARRSVARNVRRVIDARLKHADKQLAGAAEGDRDHAVHEARKDIKRARAVLRLLRPVLDPSVARRTAADLRAAARSLAGARDRHVLRLTLERLVVDDAALEGAAALRRAHLEARYRDDAHGAGDAEARAALETARGRVRAWTLRAKGWTALEPGLRRLYRRGARRAVTAFEADDDDALHELRRHAKDLGYALQLLEPSWPQLLGATRAEFERLADLLGDDHDLVLLRAELGDHADAAALQGSAVRAGAALRAEARPLAARLYAERPAAFVARHRRYWRVWRRGSRAEPDPEAVAPPGADQAAAAAPAAEVDASAP